MLGVRLGSDGVQVGLQQESSTGLSALLERGGKTGTHSFMIS